ncbi:MAG TPA: hypothetical protein VFT43_02795 [Candidatus Polarisedimenticolia bacterium]|nr:hypothetical protein [Candidatus Polarisedimenticolia bacterium]
MSREQHGRGASPRRSYQPPQLQKVRLIPDEAVLASCKNNATAGPAGPIQKCATNPAVCSHSAS